LHFEIPRVASTRCKPIYAQATRAAGAHFDHIVRPHLRIPLRADHACVFLNNALGNPRASSEQGFASRSLRMRTAFVCPVVEMVDKSDFEFNIELSTGLASRILNFNQVET
jgi:hypothetical protein